MTHWLDFCTKRLAVVPYIEGTPVFRDGTLPYIYYRLKEENKIAATFCGDNKNLDSFVSYFDRIKTAQILARVRESGNLEPVGVGWVDLPRGVDGARACQCGQAFFGDASRTPDARDLARLALAYSFEALKIDIFHGVQLESNYAARNFSLKLGFREVGLIPKWHSVDGELQAARVMMLEKTEFWPAFQSWYDAQELAKNANTVEIPV